MQDGNGIIRWPTEERWPIARSAVSRSAQCGLSGARSFAVVEFYRERVGQHGAPNMPDSETLWLRYRQMVPHAMFMWLGTIGSNKLQPQMQKPEISLANIDRSAQACADLEAFAALGM